MSLVATSTACVFPASAGVFLSRNRCIQLYDSIPRIRGGVSCMSTRSGMLRQYSPHPRGCFQDTGVKPKAGDVFPASAGVFLRRARQESSLRSIPRIRGGVSSLSDCTLPNNRYSPHPRGCFFYHTDRHKMDTVFPASAGVFLNRQLNLGYSVGIPRIRGGVSRSAMSYATLTEYSPHPRGCFYSLVA